MSSNRFKVVFRGEIKGGFSEQQVKANLQKILKVDAERLEQIYGRASLTLKKGLSAAEAEALRGKLEFAGILVTVEETSEPDSASSGQATPATTAAVPEPNGLKVEEGQAFENGAHQAEPLAVVAQPETELEAFDFQQASPVASVDVAKPGVATGLNGGDNKRIAQVQFTGSGGEYFGIWIVNILLTILTLGIYSAWAKVRNNQYFYGNTQVEGSSFQYLAKPLTILKGRIVAFIALLIWAVVSKTSPEGALILALLFVPLMPWIVVRSLKFNAVNSAYRNIRFNFEGKYWQAVMVLFVWPLLSMLTLLILLPFSMFKTHQFMINGSRFGTTPFAFKATAGDYFVFFVKVLAVALGFGVIAALSHLYVSSIMAGAVAAVGYLMLFGFFIATLTNLYVNSVMLAGHGFQSNLARGRTLWIFFSNSLLIGLTLGLYTPWAKVRMAKYRAQCMQVLIAGDLNHFVAGEQGRVSALGQEMGDAFDIEIAPI